MLSTSLFRQNRVRRSAVQWGGMFGFINNPLPKRRYTGMIDVLFP